MTVTSKCSLASDSGDLAVDLHIPVGASRIPAEEFIQFLIAECKFDSVGGWWDRPELWRLRRAAVVAREAPEEAARVLRELGHVVTAPKTVPDASERMLRTR